MSTFDGYVKEFPNIRIDYFRKHPDKAPPAACFLSHVHSDHLLGLESLKMPFVYCSATTRRLLLRMEKYPYRINYARGILESRKQHYHHLKLVLRALPLHTSTELELGPKSNIRVILIDANHCPGSVMFLIEDDTKAILYTGDVRAEPWWVNSIVQNPFLLPYSCSLRRLDCLYLDTTFCTSDDAYRHFQTKREGLNELLEKASSFPPDTVFYFRAWTLGYEDVWIALSNLLRCQVHVDDYQLNLFASIIENGRDGFSMFEGPALMGFPIGNHVQSGCLGASSDTKLHSCEPGMECHTNLRDNNVVYCTPIVSRMSDGTELLEVGAGGGFGDFRQAPELELSDAQTIEAFRTVCMEMLKDQGALEKVNKLIQATLSSGSTKISLDGLGLDAKEEIPLREFVELVSKKKSLPESDRNDKENIRQRDLRNGSRDRVIRFPFSRHSSYEELRHLVSIFRPRDICPCTVDLETWTEDATMKSLFGDLCSEAVFHHDQEIDAEARERRRVQDVKNRLKRKRKDDSQESGAEGHHSQQDEFMSARASVGSECEGQNEKVDTSATAPHTEESSLSRRPLLAPNTLEPVDVDEDRRSLNENRRRNVRAEFHALNNTSDLITKDEPQSTAGQSVSDEISESQPSQSLSAFDSQLLQDDAGRVSQLDGMYDSTSMTEPQEVKDARRTRRALRQDAHNAARRALWQNESGHWDDLNIRSVGRADHSKVEIEL